MFFPKLRVRHRPGIPAQRVNQLPGSADDWIVYDIIINGYFAEVYRISIWNPLKVGSVSGSEQERHFACRFVCDTFKYRVSVRWANAA